MSQNTSNQIVIPRVNKIVQTEEDLFCAYDSDEILLFVTEHQVVANLYFSLPAIFEEQARKINELLAQLDNLLSLATDNEPHIIH